MGEMGEELIRVGDQMCSVPVEMYELTGFGDVLCMDVWNECLSEEERFGLTMYLPDMDHDTFMRTLKELFTGCNIHFGSPVIKFFDMLKGGLCEPGVAVYRQGISLLQNFQHYHLLRKHHDSMVAKFYWIKNVWSNYRGYRIEEKLGVLKILNSQKSLMSGKMEVLETDFSKREESDDGLWGERLKGWKVERKAGKNCGDRRSPAVDFTAQGRQMDEKQTHYVTQDHQVYGRNHAVNRLSYFEMLATRLYNSRFPNDYIKNPKSLKYKQQVDVNHHLNSGKLWASKLAVGGNQTELDRVDPFCHDRVQGETSPLLPPEYKKRKLERNFPDLKAADKIFDSEFRAKTSLHKDGAIAVQIGRLEVPAIGGIKGLMKGERTGLDSPEQSEGHDKYNPYMRNKLAFPSSVSSVKSGSIPKKENFVREDQRSGGLLDRLISMKKRKVKDNLTYINELDDNECLLQQQFDSTIYPDKCGKGKLVDTVNISNEGVIEPSLTPLAENAEVEPKAQNKPFTLITPTLHYGFSFSVIHLLSAVRMAMVTVLPADALSIGKHNDENDERLVVGENQNEKKEGIADLNNLEKSRQVNFPSLTIQDIVNRVRSNPGDPCILETREPLQDLVRGVLKVFASKRAPLRAKGWRRLAYYEKSKKSWSWVGPFPKCSSDQEAIEEVTCPEAWGLPRKVLEELVDSFATWLKSTEETLKQIGSLPSPPLTLFHLNLDDNERFRYLRAQKSPNTVSTSCSEVRDYFRMEEVLRYSIPDRAFSYTAVDGKKSIVAPLRRYGGKLTAKARDHFMLKHDRPSHVTILCLVRDAAARLPGSIGTRADVCTLIRDSQYIVQDVSDEQVNQVVSGALDRLSYERDPCVKFDRERKLWVYLHREREEEDFEDDVTSSTKKWKRQKKEAQVLEPLEQRMVTLAYRGNDEVHQTGFVVLDVDPSCTADDKRVDLSYHDDGHFV